MMHHLTKPEKTGAKIAAASGVSPLAPPVTSLVF